MSEHAPQLTAKWIAVLKIRARHRGTEYSLTCAEIDAKSFPHGTRRGLREWVNDALKALHSLECVEPLGLAASGGRRWGITNLGFAVFAAASLPARSEP
ncbi:hypothetical protein AB4099_30390 [Bosea sp. 2KB_26]|uniref:hypothetical protein n=1 Tax=Bosea sp. 2KB_26 TaxID=3237475 RepID=UPI000DE3CBDE